ncbi:MAG: TonB-dependent receptor [Flavobacteriales bacterium]|nr:TonB-dependent receptor [Flavobacteriales bacterium]
MNIFKYTICAAVLLCAFTFSFGQNKPTDANIVGHIIDAQTKEHLPFINVLLKGTTIGTATDASGHYYLKNLPEGTYTLSFQSMGYKTQNKNISISLNKTIEMNIEMEQDIAMMDDVVITGNRNEVSRKMSSIVVGVAGPKLYEATNAPAVGCALNFQPGLRTENDCQNCGFMQVRINGMEGHYSQIMIDSHPMLSALAGVYGLEQYPADMVERVEVIRGGGSALFGSSAIAGTVNIITKEPSSNNFNIGHTTTLMGGSAPDNVSNIGATIVSEDRKAGAHIFGMVRSRAAYDQNNDDFSDIPLINSSSVGFTGYYKPSLYSKITVEYHNIKEFRRGGDNLDLPAHEAMITEQTDHNINGGSVSYTWFDAAQKNRVNVYTAMQNIDRKSYYGAGKDPNAYGKTTDFTVLAGGQYTHDFQRFIFMPSQMTAGVEYNYNSMEDIMVGYNRDLEQKVNIISAFFQNEWKNEKWGILIGARLDKHNMISSPIVSPRINLRRALGDVNLRASWATGFRAPQAFDEDLHITAVGGDVQIIQISPDLKQESSQSFSFSADYAHAFSRVQIGFLAEGFYTRLKDVFILEPKGQDEQGHTIMERVNGGGATVIGVNLEGKIAFSKHLEIQAGATIQNSTYSTPYAWSEDPDVEEVKHMLRSPDVYGYFTISAEPFKCFKIDLTGTYTGSMTVEHFAGYIEKDRLETTPTFMDMGLKLSYDVHISPHVSMDIYLGAQNIFNSYQSDLDKGALRDSGYIYGPATPRSYYGGLKFNLL